MLTIGRIKIRSGFEPPVDSQSALDPLLSNKSSLKSGVLPCANANTK